MDYTERNRRWAAILLRQGAHLTSRGLGLLAEGIEQAASDLEAGRTKEAKRELATVKAEIKEKARDTRPEVHIYLVQLGREVERIETALATRPPSRPALADRSAIEAEFRRVE